MKTPIVEWFFSNFMVFLFALAVVTFLITAASMLKILYLIWSM